MNTGRQKFFTSGMSALLFAADLSGCTLGGFFIGKGIDDAEPDRDTVAIHNLEKLPQYDGIEFVMKNGLDMQGKRIEVWRAECIGMGRSSVVSLR